MFSSSSSLQFSQDGIPLYPLCLLGLQPFSSWLSLPRPVHKSNLHCSPCSFKWALFSIYDIYFTILTSSLNKHLHLILRPYNFPVWYSNTYSYTLPLLNPHILHNLLITHLHYLQISNLLYHQTLPHLHHLLVLVLLISDKTQNHVFITAPQLNMSLPLPPSYPCPLDLYYRKATSEVASSHGRRGRIYSLRCPLGWHQSFFG